MAHNSKTAFERALAETGLTELKAKFTEFGWDTYNDFAFSTSDPAGKDPERFQKEVIDAILPDDGSKKSLIPKLRRLYAQSYIHATKAMNDEADPKPVTEVVQMHPADRWSRTQKLKDRITGWSLAGMNLPSQALVDKFATMMAKAHVKYVAWEKCTSKEQETLEEPEVKGLRITADGLLLQDVAKDMRTDLAGEFLWDFALRRRACAGDIAGMICYEAQNEWQEILKAAFLKSPPPGHRRVTWAQLRNADVELWTQVATECEDGLKETDVDGVTKFERAWRSKMSDQDVRACLAFLPGPAASTPTSSTAIVPVNLVPGPGASGGDSSAEILKLKRRIENQNNQINNMKYAKTGKGKGKDKGKKGKGKGNRQHSAPPDLGGRPAKTPDNEPICFTFNRSQGCPLAKPGAACHRGRHVCIECYGNHSLTLPCPKLS